MKKQIVVLLAALAFGGTLLAQKVKSQKELDALMAIQNATDADARIAAVENLLQKFVDTEFKPMALEVAADAARAKGDAATATVYFERALEVNPKSITALSSLAKLTAEGTREFDLDKEEKLTKADGYAKKTLEIAPTVPKPNANMTDEQWEAQKKDTMAQAHEALAAALMVRKKHDAAIAEYKLALETGSQPDPATMVRLGIAYNTAGKFDDSIAMLDKVIAIPDVHPQIKQVAANEKVKAVMNKKKASPAAAAPAPPAAPAVPAQPAAVPVKQ